MNREGSTRRDARVMCGIIQVVSDKVEKRTRKYRNNLL